MDSMPAILTIGHSRHPLERFIELLEGAGVTAVADVRSAPYSRFSPQFNKTDLAASLAAREIDYFFLGKELGGRPARTELYTRGVADYEKMAAAPEFRAGLARLMELAREKLVAVICAEADPLDCHRCLLIGRALAEAGREVSHILPSGEIITHSQAEDRLLAFAKLGEEELLRSCAERLRKAYRLRNRKAGFAAH